MTPEEYISQSLQTKEVISAIVRELASVKVPEFSSEELTVKDAAKLIGLSESSIRAGIRYGWLPIGVIVKDGRSATCKTEHAKCIIFPRKVWELTGHVWRGKEKLKCSEKA